MKHLLYLSSIIVLISFQKAHALDSAANGWGDVTNCIQMSINLKDGGQMLRTNQPVELTVRYRNVSTNETVFIYSPLLVAADVTYLFQVVSPSGKDISPVSRKTSPAGSSVDRAIPPNGIIQFEIDLSRLCRFEEAGTYKVIVKKVILPQKVGEWFTVVSNQLDFDITD